MINLRKIYFQDLIEKLNLSSYSEFFTWFDEAFTDLLEGFIPLRANFLGVNYLNNLKKLKNALIRAYKDCNVNIRQHPENLKNKKIKKIFENEIFEKKCKFLDNYSHIIGHSSTLMNIALLKGLNVLSFNPFNKKDFNCPLFERGLINEGKEFEDVINFINLKK